MYDVSIARLIPIIKLTFFLVKFNRQYFYYIIKMENKKKNIFWGVKLGIFCLELGTNILFGIGNGAKFRPQNQVIESPD